MKVDEEKIRQQLKQQMLDRIAESKHFKYIINKLVEEPDYINKIELNVSYKFSGSSNEY